jgi:uncharacterized circularly permuted ATP-grasp superfamily protein
MESWKPTGLLKDYDPDGFYCELLGFGENRPANVSTIRDRLDQMSLTRLRERAVDAERELYNFGITFTVYTQKDAIDRILPFSVIPRVITAEDWETIRTGVIQRVTTLNLFLHDIYHDQKILKDGLVPKDLVLGNANYRPEMQGLDVPGGVYVHINGTGIVRDGKG